MVEVDVPNIRSVIENLESIIGEYEEIELNLFNQLKDCCINNWQDGNSADFEDQMYVEKQESDMILESLNDKKDIYEFIYNEYSDIGRKIKMNLNGRSRVLSTIDRAYDNARTVISLFSSVDTGYRYGGDILAQKAKIQNVKYQLSNLKMEVNSLYSRVEQIENEIRNKINSLDILRINGFAFKLGGYDR